MGKKSFKKPLIKTRVYTNGTGNFPSNKVPTSKSRTWGYLPDRLASIENHMVWSSVTYSGLLMGYATELWYDTGYGCFVFHFKHPDVADVVAVIYGDELNPDWFVDILERMNQDVINRPDLLSNIPDLPF